MVTEETSLDLEPLGLHLGYFSVNLVKNRQLLSFVEHSALQFVNFDIVVITGFDELTQEVFVDCHFVKQRLAKLRYQLSCFGAQVKPQNIERIEVLG